MRGTFYSISIMSCGVLAYLFYQRDQLVWAGVILAVGLMYIVRLLVVGRNERAERAQERAEEYPSRITNKQAKEIIEKLKATQKRAQSTRFNQAMVVVIVLAVAGATYPSNWALGLAISLFSLPLLWLIYKNTRVIGEIKQGLAGR